MARVVGIDHLDLRVKDIERSRCIYDLVGFLGCKDKDNFAGCRRLQQWQDAAVDWRSGR